MYSRRQGQIAEGHPTRSSGPETSSFPAALESSANQMCLADLSGPGPGAFLPLGLSLRLYMEASQEDNYQTYLLILIE